MKRLRLWMTGLTLVGLILFWPAHAQSRQYFEATMRFNPVAGTMWHYYQTTILIGDEIEKAHRTRVGGIIATVYDEKINSSGGGLVGVHVSFNNYQSLDLGVASKYENPSGGPAAPPEYRDPVDGTSGQGGAGTSGQGGATPEQAPDILGMLGQGPIGPAEPEQAIGGGPGGGGGSSPGGGGGSDTLLGEGKFEITPIIESDINYIISESGRMLDLSGMDLIGDIIDPSRSITVRQVFQTAHFVVLPDYQVHLNEQWRAPMSWTIPFVGETMDIPLTYRLADIRTTFRFRVAAIDFSGIEQFNVNVADEGTRPDENGKPQSVRKESNIKGDIVIQGRVYVDLDRGIIVAICDTPALGSTYFVDGQRRGGEQEYNDLGLPWALNPGFYATLTFERRDLYTPLGNVIDKRQEVAYRIQELQWLTTTVVE